VVKPVARKIPARPRFLRVFICSNSLGVGNPLVPQYGENEKSVKLKIEKK